jgi:DNA modification methylase
MIRIINADVIDGLRSLPEKSVHCVVTSPPYWGLRDYGIDGQIGLEPTPEEYLDKMVQVFREVKRVLRDDGTLWLNIGDSYANAQPRGRMEDQGDLSTGDHGELIPKRDWSCWNLKQKDLVGMCWRVAFALQSEGWYLRSDIIWAKPNPMPESITDRPTRSHEYVFLLAKSARYFYDADAVREGYSRNPLTFGNTNRTKIKGIDQFAKGSSNFMVKYGDDSLVNPAGRNRRTVWEIATQPTPEAHFATFPEALVEPCIKAGTSERGCCSVCGAPWVRVVEKEIVGSSVKRGGYIAGWDGINNGNVYNIPHKHAETLSVIWQPSCTCNAEIVPCVVLDPFGGSGTVAKVARDLNRDAILIELNPAYVEIARRKLRANEQLFTGAVKVEVQP